MGTSQLDEKAIFDVARKIDCQEVRLQYLRQVCGDDKALLDRVAALARIHDQQGRFLETPHANVSATLDFPPIAERPGTQIGPYKLIEEIGEGGMGLVYMAAQKEPVRRKVALKIIKPGMDTREVIARFAAEEQALALMDHPNIAKVFDAGTTESGRPFFVMELVNGVPLVQYCDDNNLTTHQRLELFVLVCHAVQHAHQKGIIHRDIKPSNILVTMHDGVPVPKIIDFGIAKAINQQLTANTVYTSHGQMIGTPLYMSPEQAEHSGLDIDTRSDIYSLGVLLFELLTGSTPFDGDQLKDVSYDEVRRLIREQEPPRPSTRISTLGKAATTASEHRRTSPVELSNLLRHEVDWIVMKALEKDRTRRYQTANDFARDIQRYLDDEPVEACPPSTAYRVRKFARRHKTGVLAVSAVGLVLIIGVGVAGGQAYRATKAERLAEEQLQIANEQKRLAKEQAQLAQKQKQLAEESAARENTLRVQAEEASRKAEAARQRAETVADYLVDVFRSPDPERDGRTVTVVEIMDRLQGELVTKFAEDALLRAKLLSALGKTYLGLGLPQKALAALQTSHELYLRAEGDNAPSTLRSLVDLMDGYTAAGRYKDALDLGERNLETHRAVLGEADSSTLKLSDDLVEAYLYAHRNDDAVRLGEQLLPLARKALGPRHAITRSVMNNYAWALNAVGQCQAALTLHEELLRVTQECCGREHPDTLWAMRAVAGFYAWAGRYADAARLGEETLSLMQKTLGPTHYRTLHMMANLADSHADVGNIVQAMTLGEEALQALRQILGEQHLYTIKAKMTLARLWRLTGRLEESRDLLEEAMQSITATHGAEHYDTLTVMQSLAATDLARGEYDKATAMLETIVRIWSQTSARRRGVYPEAIEQLARGYSELGRHEDAVRLAKDALKLTRELLGHDHPEAFRSMSDLAEVLRKAGRLKESLDLLQQAVPSLQSHLGDAHDETLTATTRLAIALGDLGQCDQAIALHSSTLVLRKKTFGESSPQTLVSMALLGSAYLRHGKSEPAEPLLVAAYEGFSRRHTEHHTPFDHAQAREACTQLVQLYEKSNQPDKATAWKEKLTALTEEPKKDEAGK